MVQTVNRMHGQIRKVDFKKGLIMCVGVTQGNIKEWGSYVEVEAVTALEKRKGNSYQTPRESYNEKISQRRAAIQQAQDDSSKRQPGN